VAFDLVRKKNVVPGGRKTISQRDAREKSDALWEGKKSQRGN